MTADTNKDGKDIVARKDTINELVAVVRCRNCKYFYHEQVCSNEQWGCEECYNTVRPDDYCSFGEQVRL